MGKRVFDELEAMSGMGSEESISDIGEQQATQPADEGQQQGGQQDDAHRQLQEERARRQEAEKARDDLIRQALAGMSGQQGQQGQQQADAGDSSHMNEVLESLDEDVAQAVTQIVQSENRKFVEQFMQQYGPVLEGVTRDQSIKEIDQRVEGFSNELMDDVEKEYQALSDEEKEEYGRSRAGIEALALRVKLRKMQEQQGQGASSGGLSSMAQTTPGSREFSQATSGSSEGGFDPWAVPSEDFDKLLGKIQNGEVR